MAIPKRKAIRVRAIPPLGAIQGHQPASALLRVLSCHRAKAGISGIQLQTLPPAITVPTGRIQHTTEVQEATVQRGHTRHLQGVLAAPTSEVLHTKAAAPATTAGHHRRQEAIHPAAPEVQAVLEVQADPLPHHQEEGRQRTI